MNLLLVSAGLVAIIVIIYALRRKKTAEIILEKNAQDHSQEHPQKNTFYNKVNQVRDYHEIEEVVEELKKTGAIRPEGNQQRNLDREVGGLEAEKQKESSEKDVWDDRSDQIDKEGAIDQLGSAAKKSMIWRIKQGKMADKKHAASADAAAAHHENRKQGSGASFDSSYSNQGGLGQMIKARNDHDHGGGMSR